MKLHIVQIAAYLVIIAAGLKAAAPVLNVVFLTLLIGTSIVPVLLWLLKKGVPKAASLLITILLLILGVDFAFLWAFLSFMFSFIPSIGFILSVIPPAFIALMQSGPTACLIILVGFILINGIVENVLRPRFMGKELDMSLTTIFLSLIFWTWLLGAMGAVLAIPLTIAVIKAKEIFFPDNFLTTTDTQ